jgi:hypothetical protein
MTQSPIDDEVNLDVPVWVLIESMVGPESRDAVLCELSNPNDTHTGREFRFLRTPFGWACCTDPELGEAMVRAYEYLSWCLGIVEWEEDEDEAVKEK